MPTSQEVVLNKPLSGQEVGEIILRKLTTAIKGDTRLSDYAAYPAFQYRLDLIIMLQGAVPEHSTLTVTHEGGKGTVDESSDQLKAVTLHQEQQEMPPNEARVDAGLEVPVLGHDERGRPVEKGVKFPKETINRAKGR